MKRTNIPGFNHGFYGRGRGRGGFHGRGRGRFRYTSDFPFEMQTNLL